MSLAVSFRVRRFACTGTSLTKTGCWKRSEQQSVICLTANSSSIKGGILCVLLGLEANLVVMIFVLTG
jgi:hypothetical protein